MILMYHTHTENAQEIAELIQDSDQEIQIVNDICTLVSRLKTSSVSKLYFQVRGLSDFRTLDMLLSISPDLDISLLVKPEMEKLLTLMQTISFEILPTEDVLVK